MSLVITVELDADSPNSPGRSNQLFRWINPGQILVVGRSLNSADLVISDDPLVSSQHFQLECHGDTSIVRDLNSTNGTYLNDEPIAEATLTDDAFVTAGHTRFHVHLPNAVGVNVSGEPAESDNDLDLDPTIKLSRPVAVPDEAAALSKGWEIELSDWPEPLSVEIQESVFEHHKIPVSDQSAPSANVVLMIHDDCPVAQSRKQSRPIAWIQSDQKLVVGRSPTHSDWAIAADSYLSGKHFEITNEMGQCRLNNLSATNGTWVNGQRVESTLLRDQDLILAGETVLQIGINGGVPLSDQDIRIDSTPSH